MPEVEVSVEKRYTVAVRDGALLFLFLWVKRSVAGDFYAFLHRPHDEYQRSWELPRRWQVPR